MLFLTIADLLDEKLTEYLSSSFYFFFFMSSNLRRLNLESKLESKAQKTSATRSARTPARPLASRDY